MNKDARNILIILDLIIIAYFFGSWFGINNHFFGPGFMYYIVSPIFLIGLLHFVFSTFKSK